MNPLLKLCSDELHQKFTVFKRDRNILEIGIPNEPNPIAFLIVEPELPDLVAVSVAVDFDNSPLISTMVISLSRVVPLVSAEPFYYDTKNELHWDEDAYNYFELENKVDLTGIEPLNDYRN
jgi:hypothetical protein